MKTVVVAYKQSILDITIQTYGDVEKLFDLAMDNNIGITDTLEPAQQLNYNDNNNTIAEYFESKKYHPATDASHEQLSKEEGIEFWYVLIDFAVS